MNRKYTPETLTLRGGELRYYADYLTPAASVLLADQLRRELAWEQTRITVYGKEHPIPRLNAWYGEAGASYRYSGKTFQPKPWHASLLALRNQLECDLELNFNSVLANCYRDGDDAMGWHADNEPELGLLPVVAAISLGAERTLRFRPRDRSTSGFGLLLRPGSLLVMGPGIQSEWQHSLPRRARAGERISLTFRRVTAPGNED